MLQERLARYSQPHGHTTADGAYTPRHRTCINMDRNMTATSFNAFLPAQSQKLKVIPSWFCSCLVPVYKICAVFPVGREQCQSEAQCFCGCSKLIPLSGTVRYNTDSCEGANASRWLRISIRTCRRLGQIQAQP